MKNSTFIILVALVIAGCVTAGCSDTGTAPQPTPTPTGRSTFQQIQTEIFAKSCAVSGCHAGSTPTGNMSLEGSAAFANLINVEPANPVAKSDGLRRVRPGKPDSSFLYLKVAGMLKDGHGARMPLGSAALDSGKIEFIRQWIAAGAPETGRVADSVLLSAQRLDFIPLETPAQGAGLQLHLNPFDIPAHGEREVFYFGHSPNTTTEYVSKFHVRMRDNSHHFVLYTYPKSATILPPAGEYRDQGGDMEVYAASRQFFLGSQVSDFTYEFPEGVAMPLPPNSGLDMNSHYVNGGDGKIQGEVYVNLYTIKQPKRIAKNFFWNKTDFAVPPFATHVVRDTAFESSDIDIFMLTSHTHRRGKSFRVYVVGGEHDGEMIYESTDWHSPTVKTFPTPFRLRRGEGLRTEVTYYNNSEFMVGFGLTSEDEMCILLGYYAQA